MSDTKPMSDGAKALINEITDNVKKTSQSAVGELSGKLTLLETKVDALSIIADSIKTELAAISQCLPKKKTKAKKAGDDASVASADVEAEVDEVTAEVEAEEKPVAKKAAAKKPAAKKAAAKPVAKKAAKKVAKKAAVKEEPSPSDDEKKSQ